MSRNPRVVRALVDIGLMRDQAEGIPRMFAEMEGQLLPAPGIDVRPREFIVTLRNIPTLTEQDRSFVSSLSPDITGTEFRALLEVYRRGRVDNRGLREITGLDTLQASALLRRLRERGLLTMHGAGPASYYELGGTLAVDAGSSVPQGSLSLEPAGEPDADRGGVTPNDAIDLEAQRILSELGPRPRKAKLRQAILELTALRPWRSVELADALAFNPGKLVERHLKEMVAEGLLERTHPDNLAHPQQAYRAVSAPEKTDDE